MAEGRDNLEGQILPLHSSDGALQPVRRQLNEPDVASRLASISALDATLSSAQTLGIISALVLAITFTGGTPLNTYPRSDELPTAHYPAPKSHIASPAEYRFLFAILLVQTSAFSCAMFSVFFNLLSIIDAQTALILHHHTTDHPPQNILEHSAPLQKYRGNLKWLLKHMSTFTLLSVILLMIVEIMRASLRASILA